MKKIFILLTISAISLSGCKFINEKILKNNKKELEQTVANLEKELYAKESGHELELSQIKKESQARIDSIINYYESELTGSGRRYADAASGTYYLIVGSFKTPVYAENYSAKVADMGYKSEIVKVGYWNFVSAESRTSLRESLNVLENLRDNVAYDAWIYVAR